MKMSKLKRQAGILSKECGLSHTKALELASKLNGFKNYHQAQKETDDTDSPLGAPKVEVGSHKDVSHTLAARCACLVKHFDTFSELTVVRGPVPVNIKEFKTFTVFFEGGEDLLTKWEALTPGDRSLQVSAPSGRNTLTVCKPGFLKPEAQDFTGNTTVYSTLEDLKEDRPDAIDWSLYEPGRKEYHVRFPKEGKAILEGDTTAPSPEKALTNLIYRSRQPHVYKGAVYWPDKDGGMNNYAKLVKLLLESKDYHVNKG